MIYLNQWQLYILQVLDIKNMSIEIKITIPDSELANWDEFQNDGIESVKMTLRKEMYDHMRKCYIRSFEIEITEKN